MGGTVRDGWSWTNVCDGPGWTPVRSGELYVAVAPSDAIEVSWEGQTSSSSRRQRLTWNGRDV